MAERIAEDGAGGRGSLRRAAATDDSAARHHNQPLPTQHARREARLAAGTLRRHVRCGEDDQDATEERAERPEQNREASAEAVKIRLRLLNS